MISCFKFTRQHLSEEQYFQLTAAPISLWSMQHLNKHEIYWHLLSTNTMWSLINPPAVFVFGLLLLCSGQKWPLSHWGVAKHIVKQNVSSSFVIDLLRKLICLKCDQFWSLFCYFCPASLIDLRWYKPLLLKKTLNI